MYKFITFVMAFMLWTTVGHARNDYLQSDQHCQGPTLEPYMEYSKQDNTGTGTSNSGYEDDRGTVGVRLRIPLTSTCSKEYSAAKFRAESLSQLRKLA